MNHTVHSLLMILICTLVTAGIRFAPFLLFPSEAKTPKALDYLGEVLPGAIMGMLVVYCFRFAEVTSRPFALPEIIAAAAVVGSYLWKKNTLISIGLGTVLYMILVQAVFV